MAGLAHNTSWNRLHDRKGLIVMPVSAVLAESCSHIARVLTLPRVGRGRQAVHMYRPD